RVYPVQPVTSGTPAPAGARRFEQVVIPQQPGTMRLPPVRFSWLDPKARASRSAEQPAITLTVRPAPKGSGPQILGGPGKAAVAPAESLGRDIVFIKDSAGSSVPIGAQRCRSPVFWLVQLVPLLLLGAAIALARHRERLGSDVRYAR